MKAYEAGNFSKMGDYIAADAVDHGGESGDVTGLDNIVSEMKRYHDMMPDMKMTDVVSLANDDYVFTWSTMTYTENGTPKKMTGVDVSKFKDGKAVEHWVYMDPKELAAMMMQNMPAQAMPGDSTAK
jgi:predicted SnoaL-like aldol condensation-catalyzing enzyme